MHREPRWPCISHLPEPPVWTCPVTGPAAHHSPRGRHDNSAFAILGVCIRVNGVRRSAARRVAEQVESIAQGVAQRVIDLVVESLDMNALIAQIDLNAVLARVDLNEVVDRIDLNEVVDRVDMNKLLARVDINQIVSRIDVESLVKNTDLGAIMVSSSSTLATEAVDQGRSHAVSMDDTLARWVSKIRRNHTGRAEPPELPNTPEEP